MKQTITAQSVCIMVAAGLNNASLIEWADKKQDPVVAIEASKADFIARGWTWNAELHQLEREGWHIFYRSQGPISHPIIQWSRDRK